MKLFQKWKMRREINGQVKELKSLRKDLEEFQNIPKYAEKADQLMKRLIVCEGRIIIEKQYYEKIFHETFSQKSHGDKN